MQHLLLRQHLGHHLPLLLLLPRPMKRKMSLLHHLLVHIDRFIVLFGLSVLESQ
jgi:hypothetical protein